MMAGQDYEIRITRRAEKDISKLPPKLKRKLRDILIRLGKIADYVIAPVCGGGGVQNGVGGQAKGLY